jgi:hypothetical protein
MARNVPSLRLDPKWVFAIPNTSHLRAFSESSVSVFSTRYMPAVETLLVKDSDHVLLCDDLDRMVSSVVDFCVGEAVEQEHG